MILQLVTDSGFFPLHFYYVVAISGGRDYKTKTVSDPMNQTTTEEIGFVPGRHHRVRDTTRNINYLPIKIYTRNL